VLTGDEYNGRVALPNILFITTDQQHPDALGMFDERFRTPHLDRLAIDGMTFTRSYSSCPLCTPARATWLTGQYPFTHGAWSIGTNLDPHALSLPKLLKEQAGYRTAIIGKSHLQAGGQPKNIEGENCRNDTTYFRAWDGPWYGFDFARINIGHVDAPQSASMHYRAWLEERGVEIDRYFRSTEDNKIGPCEWDLPLENHPSTWVADTAIEYLEDHAKHHADRPCYVNVNFPEPHRPFKVSQPWYDRFSDTKVGAPNRRWEEWSDKSTLYRAYINGRVRDLEWHDHVPPPSMAEPGRYVRPELADRYDEEEIGRIRVYSAMVGLVDDRIGAVLDALERQGMANNTLVLCTSDHGEYLGEHFIWGKGAAHYDSCVRVPMIAKWPGHTPHGVRSSSLISNVDIAPTLLDAANLAIPAEMQGVSFTETFADASAAKRTGVLIDNRAERDLYVNSWITGRYRLSVYHIRSDQNEIELFDLEEDPNEYENLASAKPALVAELMAELLAERSNIAAPWQPRPCFA
jgi:arylsulfatase A-like enzyme